MSQLKGSLARRILGVLIAILTLGLSACASGKSTENGTRRPDPDPGWKQPSGPVRPKQQCHAAAPDDAETEDNGFVEWTLATDDVLHSESIATRDLTSDGVLDVVIGGRVDGDPVQVLAIDGSTGEYLWRSPVSIAPVVLVDFGHVNDDDVPDVIVGGRGLPQTEPLLALDGRDGSVLWRVEAVEPPWQNVYKTIALDDVDGDGIVDWLIASSGDHIRPNDQPVETPGRLSIISGKDGTVVALLALPIKQEIYQSPVMISPSGRDQAHDDTDAYFIEGVGGSLIAIGSGGETFPGYLWAIPCGSVLDEDPTGFRRYGDDREWSSFIAPAVVTESEADQRSHLISVRTDGLVERRDPWSGTSFWSVNPFEDHQKTLGDDWVVAAFASPAIAQLDDDPQLEFIVMATFVERANLEAGEGGHGDIKIVALDGTTGNVEAEILVPDGDSVAGPLAITVNGKPMIVCSCARREDVDAADDQVNMMNLGLWDPANDQITDLNIPADPTSTPAVVRYGEGLGIITGGLEGAGEDANWTLHARHIDGTTADDLIWWGGYMGTRHDGRLVPPEYTTG